MSGKRKRSSRRNRGRGNVYLATIAAKQEARANNADLSATRRGIAVAQRALQMNAPAPVESTEDKSARLLADMARLMRGT